MLGGALVLFFITNGMTTSECDFILVDSKAGSNDKLLNYGSYRWNSNREKVCVFEDQIISLNSLVKPIEHREPPWYLFVENDSTMNPSYSILDILRWVDLGLADWTSEELPKTRNFPGRPLPDFTFTAEPNIILFLEADSRSRISTKYAMIKATWSFSELLRESKAQFDDLQTFIKWIVASIKLSKRPSSGPEYIYALRYFNLTKCPTEDRPQGMVVILDPSEWIIALRTTPNATSYMLH